jgi:hypothetical protein
MKIAPRIRLESLEPRIAPANLVINGLGTRATWTDVDGDDVVLTSTAKILDAADFIWLAQGAGDVGFQLAKLELSDDFASGTTLTFTARRSAAHGGDGFVNVGWIDAATSDLAAIRVDGDLARLGVGDINPATPALGSITVHSGGAIGGLSQGATISGGPATVDWIIYGRLGTMTVKGDYGANLNVFGSSNNRSAGSIGTINILGDLFANDPALTDTTIFTGKGAGYLFASGTIGSVKIAGDIIGGSSTYSGSVSSLASITSVTVGGNVSGGRGDYSGEIFADITLGSVTVGGDLVSGRERDENGTPTPPFAAGSIGAGMSIGKVTVGGGAFGGASFFGGSIYTPIGSFGKIGAVTIKGVLSGRTDIFGSGPNASVVFNGIYSDSTIGAVTVGSLFGLNPASPVNIVAKGLLNPLTNAQALAIASVTVTRGMTSAQILAGYSSSLAAVSSDVQIGPVKIGNSMTGSSIIAGVTSGSDIYFGNTDDVSAASVNQLDNPLIRSRIASVTVGSYIYGTGSANDAFAIEAEDIGAVKIGPTVLPMTVRSALANSDDFLLGVTHDFRVREF